MGVNRCNVFLVSKIAVLVLVWIDRLDWDYTRRLQVVPLSGQSDWKGMSIYKYINLRLQRFV